uniref:Uncharacterized protein n=1 Tax=Meloidogyne enterolobii TaxID=390850 RepID=A0A6V7XTR3_MELEN|nr:unnamed protein product [Meloidogyne enterolobii]
MDRYDFTKKLKEIADRMSNQSHGLEELEEIKSAIEHRLEIKEENWRKFIKFYANNKKSILPIITQVLGASGFVCENLAKAMSSGSGLTAVQIAMIVGAIIEEFGRDGGGKI